MDNGGKRALIPIENKRQFLEVNADVLEQVDPIFFGDMRQAAFKALGGVDVVYDVVGGPAFDALQRLDGAVPGARGHVCLGVCIQFIDTRRHR